MDAFLYPSDQRGHIDHGWLNTYHSFSFGSWYHPDFVGVSALRVINEDRIAAHTGFGTHPHDNMEILTCVLSGQIHHQDSMGNHGDIAAGEWQLISAGTGVQHSEANRSAEEVHLFQIWLHPNVRDAVPSYQQVARDPNHMPNQWHNIAGSNADAAMHIRQDAEILAAVLQQGQRLALAKTHRLNYLHLMKGQVQIAEYKLRAGDALVFADNVEIEAEQDAQMLWFDLP